jgi:hypothetical protein
MNLTPQVATQVEKVILCGIASISGEDRKDLLKNVLSKVPVGNILCVQNENDRFVKYPDAEEFYHSIEPKLKVTSKPRSDHNYPYPADFRKFLS